MLYHCFTTAPLYHLPTPNAYPGRKFLIAFSKMTLDNKTNPVVVFFSNRGFLVQKQGFGYTPAHASTLIFPGCTQSTHLPMKNINWHTTEHKNQMGYDSLCSIMCMRAKVRDYA